MVCRAKVRQFVPDHIATKYDRCETALLSQKWCQNWNLLIDKSRCGTLLLLLWTFQPSFRQAPQV